MQPSSRKKSRDEAWKDIALVRIGKQIKDVKGSCVILSATERCQIRQWYEYTVHDIYIFQGRVHTYMHGKGGGCVGVNMPYYPAQFMHITPPC